MFRSKFPIGERGDILTNLARLEPFSPNLRQLPLWVDDRHRLMAAGMGGKRTLNFQFVAQSFLVSWHIRAAVVFLKSIDPSAAIASIIAVGSAALRLTASGLSF